MYAVGFGPKLRLDTLMIAHIESPCREIEAEFVLRFRPVAFPIPKPFAAPPTAQASTLSLPTQSSFDRWYALLLPASICVNALIVFLLVSLVH